MNSLTLASPLGSLDLVATSDAPAEPTYSLGAVARLTGLSPHVLRAWERRYGAVDPVRTAGGNRRYLESHVARLRLLRSAVGAGHAISEVATLPDAELLRRLEMQPAIPKPALAPVLDAFERYDAPEAARLLGQQLAALGARDFVRLVAAPLLAEVGARWESGVSCIAVEHLVSATVRSVLGAAMQPRAIARGAPRILFTTLPGDPHELGPMMAAIVATEVGSLALFAGANLPVAEIATAAKEADVAAVVVGVAYDDGAIAGQVSALRAALPRSIELWVGGAGAAAIAPAPQVTRIRDLDDLERKATLLLERRTVS